MKSEFKKCFISILAVSITLAGCSETSQVVEVDSCNEICLAQRQEIANAGRSIRLELQGALLGGVMGAALGAVLSSDRNRQQAALAGGFLGAGAGYAIGLNIRENRAEAQALASRTARDVEVAASEVTRAKTVLITLSASRKREIGLELPRLRDGSVTSNELLGGLEHDLEIANATLTRLEIQLQSINGFKRALAEERISNRSLNRSLRQFEVSVSSYKAVVVDAEELRSQHAVLRTDCIQPNDGEEEYTDDPLPRCEVNQ